MILNKIAASLCFFIPFSVLADYRVHIPLTEEFRGHLSNNSIVFTESNNGNGNNGGGNGGNNGEGNGNGETPSVDNPTLTTDSSGNSCAYNDNNYVAQERTINGFIYEYMYEWKSTHFSVPVTRGNATNSVLFYAGSYYDLEWPESKTVTIGSGASEKQIQYYKICKQNGSPD